MVESVEMGSPQLESTPGREGDYSPLTQRCPPSPPRDGLATSNGAGIRAIGAAITSVGIPPSASDNSKIVVLLDNNIDIAVDGIVILLPPSAT
jgi:hypothetical protein